MILFPLSPTSWFFLSFLSVCLCRFHRHLGRECSFTSSFYHSQVRPEEETMKRDREETRGDTTCSVAWHLFYSSFTLSWRERNWNEGWQLLFVFPRHTWHESFFCLLSLPFMNYLTPTTTMNVNSAFKSITMSGCWPGLKKRESIWISFACQSLVHVTSRERLMLWRIKILPDEKTSHPLKKE